MADHDDHLDAELDVFFTAAKRLAPRPSEDLQARILMEATRAQQRPAPKPARVSVFEMLKDFVADLGGAPATAGLATAALVGAYIGFSAPEWPEPMSSWINADTSLDADFTDPFAGLDYSFLESDT
ncbi:MAG: hypothetical protein ACO2ZX_00190 [Paracoccaceae bacterium]|jgi:hypothetical protein|nr:hypothetical protein [Paracoccaceae bacterium]